MVFEKTAILLSTLIMPQLHFPRKSIVCECHFHDRCKIMYVLCRSATQNPSKRMSRNSFLQSFVMSLPYSAGPQLEMSSKGNIITPFRCSRRPGTFFNNFRPLQEAGPQLKPQLNRNSKVAQTGAEANLGPGRGSFLVGLYTSHVPSGMLAIS